MKKNIKKRIVEEMGLETLRGNTWVGVRPTTFDSSNKKNSKKNRRESKASIRDYMKTR
jgi:hypothetical protein